MPAKLLRADFSPNLGRDRSTVTELWHVYDITGFAQDKITQVVYGQIPYNPEVGTPHPDINEATCRNMVMRQHWTDGSTSGGELLWQAIVAVYFDSQSRQSVFNPRTSSITDYSEPFRIPFRYKILSPDIKLIGYYDTERTRSRRIETRYARTAQVTEAAKLTLLAQAGNVYFFNSQGGPFVLPSPNNVPFVYKGASTVDLSNGLTRIRYTFDTLSRIAGLPSQPPANGMQVPSVSTPPLDFLDVYLAASLSPGTDTPILVSPWSDRFLIGSTLPFL